MASNWHRVVGIDLGTTFSAVAAYNYDRNEVRIIPNRQNEPTTPSVVYVSPQGQVSVGRAAKEKLARDPQGVVSEVKRIMGEKEAGAKAMVSVLGRSTYDPELISAHILKELKACAERVINEPIHDAVITVPAYFKESQKNATMEAARIAGLNPLHIMNEPTAAAVAYGIESGERQTFIVYDFGGGTFDVSIVRVNDPESFDVLGTGGDAHLGGGDIDQRIVDWALAQMNRQYGRDFSGDTRLVGRMRLEAERTKINLCNEAAPQEYVITNPIEGIPEAAYTLAVEEFEGMIQPLLQRTIKEVEVAIGSAEKKHGTTWDDIEAFILVGGSSKIPTVKRVLAERFNKPVRSDVNPDEVVAIGAGWVAKTKSPSTGPEIRDDVDRVVDPNAKPAAEHRDIRDVVSHTVGIGLKNDVYDILIPKDTVIPFRVERDGYTTAEDNQTSVYVPIYQGENPKAGANFKLGQVVIDNLTPEPKGTHRFSVTFALNASGIFEGQMKHHGTGQVHPAKLDRGQGQMTEKKRIDLANQVRMGRAEISDQPLPPPKKDDLVQLLINQTEDLMPTLPAARQQELTSLLQNLVRARANNNGTEQAAAISQLTMFLMRHKPA
jgi:molecular chaperone DnaK